MSGELREAIVESNVHASGGRSVRRLRICHLAHTVMNEKKSSNISMFSSSALTLSSNSPDFRERSRLLWVYLWREFLDFEKRDIFFWLEAEEPPREKPLPSASPDVYVLSRGKRITRKRLPESTEIPWSHDEIHDIGMGQDTEIEPNSLPRRSDSRIDFLEDFDSSKLASGWISRPHVINSRLHLTASGSLQFVV